MTEAEWRASESPVAMLNHLRVETFSRRAVLYALAVCGRRPELTTGPLRRWVAVAERVADAPGRDAFVGVQLPAEDAACRLAERGRPGTRGHYAGVADAVAGSWRSFLGECDLPNPTPPGEVEAARRANAALVRDIFGNPFRPVAFAPEWRTDTAVTLARQMYDARDFSAMPILADALQDAGCDSDDILDHCRGPGPHVRGCWVCDLVLGKE
jgi:hypothetical protein